MKKIITNPYSILIGLLLNFSLLFSQNDSIFILEDGYYFNGSKFVYFKELQIKGEKIIAISNVISKINCERIPLNKKFVLPGLIDAHIHLSGSPCMPYTFVDPEKNANSSLQCGITTNVDLFTAENSVKSLKATIDEKPQLYSSLISSGPILTAPGGHGTEYGVPTRTIKSVEEAEIITNEVASKPEIDLIKICYEGYSQEKGKHLTKEMVKKIVETAHFHHKKVIAHINNVKEAMDCVEAGVDALAHLPIDLLSPDDLKKLKQAGTLIVPTITVYQSVLEGHSAAYMTDSLLWKSANPNCLARFEQKALPKLAIPDSSIKKMWGITALGYRENLKNCIKMKIPIVAGTDAGNYATFYGYSLHNEMKVYCDAGMTPANAICAATQSIALLFPGIKTGKIAQDYLADLLILKSDPLKNIENTKQIYMVFHKGKKMKAINFKPEEPVAYDSTIFNLTGLKKLPEFIQVYSDTIIGGASSIKCKLKNEDGSNYLAISGNIIKKGFLGFAGVGFGLAKSESQTPILLNEYKSIEFDVKGNGETYFAKLSSIQVTDYNFHSAPFTAGSEWKKVKINLQDFKQANWGRPMVQLDLDSITDIHFEASGKNYSIEFNIRNIRFVK